MFIIKDKFHQEFISDELQTFEEALLEIKRLSNLPFEESPNKPPCTSWKTCHRDYQVIEYDDTNMPWEELSKIEILRLSSTEIRWLYQTF